jgi:hypothetical protein
MSSVPAERNAILMDMSYRAFFYRSKRAPFMTTEFQAQLWGGIQTLLKKDLGDEALRRRFQSGPRGPHYPCIMGHAQQYQKASSSHLNPFTSSSYETMQTPQLTLWDRENREAVRAFQNLEVVQCLL